jgi:hypothetical protein
MRAGRRGDRVELIIGPGSSGAVLPRAGRLLLVPASVDRAASSGVVPGEPSSAAVLGAGSGFAEGAHHRPGAGAAASAASQHNHAWIVPPPKQGKLFSAWPYPSPVGLAVVASGRLPPAGSSSLVALVDTVGAGLAGRGPKGSAPPGPMRCRAGIRPASPDRWAGRGVQGSREPAQRGRRSGPGRSPGRDRVACSGGRQ